MVLLFGPGCGDPAPVGPDAARALDAGPDAAPVDIAVRLAGIDGMTVVEEPTGEAGYRFFLLHYWQPADHGDPERGGFEQYMTLLHRDEAAPFVLGATGYHNYLHDYPLELTRMFQANQLSVEHRFFAGSRPEPVDWSLLSIEQAAADHHRIAEALRPIYSGKWVSTGHSKGGMTSIYHRRFYPEDVDATVAYVAPISFGAPDYRYDTFLDDTLAGACTEAIHDAQRAMLERRDDLLPRFASAGAADGYTYATIGIEAAFEGAVSGIEWAFWQYLHVSQCDQVPAPTATDTQLMSFLDHASGVSSGSDQSIARYQPYYVQAQVELGYPGTLDPHLDELLVAEALGSYLPSGLDPVHEPGAMQEIDAWVRAQGRTLMFVYGANDPWTGGSFELGAAQDSHAYVVALGNHGASIGQLAPAERDAAIATVERWLAADAMIPQQRAREMPMIGLPPPLPPRAAPR